MQSVNDDMDDLFRRASENYPLNMNSADFNKVLEGLQETDGYGSAYEKSKNGSARKFLWLFLLLPLMWICKGNDIDKGQSKIATQNTATSQQLNKKSANAQLQQEVGENKINADRSAMHSDGRIDEKISEKVHSSGLEAHHSFIEDPSLEVFEQIPDPSSRKKERSAVIIDKIENKSSDLINQNATGIINSEQENIANNQAGIDFKLDHSGEKIAEIETGSHPDNLNQEGHQQAITNTEKSKREKRLYIGLTAGPDLSMVKLQSVNNIGISKGIIAGFQLNKRLSLETGIIWDKKYYYTDGQYFSTKNLTLPSTVKIESLNGNCNMLELPLSIRYVFKSSAKIKWTGSLGFSSYLMKNESYEYMYNNSGSVYQRNKTYTTASEFWFSAMNLSVGYNRKLGKIADLRIEPYLKIPLRGVGIGELPLTSAGITIGLTRKIF